MDPGKAGTDSMAVRVSYGAEIITNAIFGGSLFEFQDPQNSLLIMKSPTRKWASQGTLETGGPRGG